MKILFEEGISPARSDYCTSDKHSLLQQLFEKMFLLQYYE
jgi:hypothetical protein